MRVTPGAVRDDAERPSIEAQRARIAREAPEAFARSPRAPLKPYIRTPEQRATSRAFASAPGAIAGRTAARRAAVRAGFFGAGPAPYGYRRSSPFHGARMMLVIVPEEAAIVRRIFACYLLRRNSMQKLIDSLHSDGVRNRRGGQWTRAAIGWMLRNRTYAGYVRMGDIQTRGRHEPIISHQLQRRAIALMDQRNKRNKRTEQITQ